MVLWVDAGLITSRMPNASVFLGVVSSLDHIKIAPDTRYEGINNFLKK